MVVNESAFYRYTGLRVLAVVVSVAVGIYFASIYLAFAAAVTLWVLVHWMKLKFGALRSTIKIRPGSFKEEFLQIGKNDSLHLESNGDYHELLELDSEGIELLFSAEHLFHDKNDKNMIKFLYHSGCLVRLTPSEDTYIFRNKYGTAIINFRTREVMKFKGEEVPFVKACRGVTQEIASGLL